MNSPFFFFRDKKNDGKIDFFVKISITHKIMLAVTLLLFIAVGTCTILSVRTQSRALTQELIQTGKRLAGDIAFSTKNAFWSLNWIFVENLLKECTREKSRNVIYAKIINPDGEVYMASDKSYYGNMMDLSFLVDHQVTLFDYFFKETMENGVLLVYPLKIKENTWYVILGLSLKSVNTSIKGLIYRNLESGLIITIVGIIISYFLARSISKPIITLSKVVKEISGNDWHTVSVNSNDEVGLLGHSFNQMIYNLEKVTSKLKSSEEKYRSIFDKAVEGIFQASPEGRFLTVNHSLAKILGFDCAQNLIHSITNIGEQLYVDRQERRRFEEQSLKYGNVQNFETRFYKKQGDIIDVTINAHPVYGNDKKVLYFEGIIQDITRRKEFEVLRIEKQAAEAKAEAKSHFLASMSHEIRTPLNIILGYSDLLKNTTEVSQRNDYADQIINSGRLLLSIINNILDLSMIEKGKGRPNFHTISIATVLADIQSQFMPEMAAKGLQFVVQMDNRLEELNVLFDEARFKQILINLIDNACKYTKSGTVAVTCSIAEYQKCTFDLEIAIEDTGIGMANTNRIFQEFEQLPNAIDMGKGGVGLGLSIVQRLVEMMNGKISVISAIGKGSQFHLYFKKIQIHNTPLLAVREDSNDKTVFEPATIIVADDDPANQRLIQDCLAIFSNLTIHTVSDGLAAVEAVRKMKADLVLMDLKMPTMDGYQATRIIKTDEKLQSTLVVVLTANAIPSAKDKIEVIGCDGFLLKPIRRSALVDELRRLLRCHEQETQARQACQPPSDAILSVEMLNKVSPNKLKTVLKSIEKLKNETWTAVSQTMIDREIKAFAKTVNTIGIDHDIAFLQFWGEKLELYTDDYLIHKRDRLFEQFPKIIDNFAKSCKVMSD